MVDPAHTRLSLVRQCRLVSIARSSFYYAGPGESPYSSPRAPQTRYCRVSVPAISTLPQPSLLAVWRKRAVVPANVVSVW